MADTDFPDAVATFEFDHGCQFFRADTDRMREICRDWLERGWAAPFGGHFGRVGSRAADFFGLPSDTAPVFVGVGGMQRLPRARVIEQSRSTVFDSYVLVYVKSRFFTSTARPGAGVGCRSSSKAAGIPKEGK